LYLIRISHVYINKKSLDCISKNQDCWNNSFREHLTSEFGEGTFPRAGNPGGTPGLVEMEDPKLNDEPQLRGEGHAI